MSTNREEKTGHGKEPISAKPSEDTANQPSMEASAGKPVKGTTRGGTANANEKTIVDLGTEIQGVKNPG